MKNLMENKILQKIILWAFLLASAAIFVGALMYSTNFRYFSSSNTGSNLAKVINSLASDEFIDKYFSTKDAQAKTLNNYKNFVDSYNAANNSLLLTGVIGVVLFAVLCIFGNKYRKKYYLSNLIVGLVANIAMVLLVIVSIILNIKVWANFADAKPTLRLLKETYDQQNFYPLSLSYCYATFAIQIISLVVFGFNIAYTVIKFIFSKSNDEMISENNLNDAEEVTE